MKAALRVSMYRINIIDSLLTWSLSALVLNLIQETYAQTAKKDMLEGMMVEHALSVVMGVRYSCRFWE